MFILVFFIDLFFSFILLLFFVVFVFVIVGGGGVVVLVFNEVMDMDMLTIYRHWNYLFLARIY